MPRAGRVVPPDGSMAFITHVDTALPPHAIGQSVAADAVARSCRLDGARSAAVRTLFERARVTRRYSVIAPDGIGEPMPLTRTMTLYRRHALELALAAARRCLAESGVEPRSIDLVVTTSCTGVLLPSLAALVVEPLGLRRDVRRLPLTELGCAGGASALARAHEFSRAFPGANVLVLAVELPSLTFQSGDSSPGNLVASAIFGDGAAAVLVQDVARRGLEIVATHTEMFPDSLGDMGFELRDGGLHVVLSKDVPTIIARETPGVVREFLARAGVFPSELGFYALHAGGSKVLEELERGLRLDRAQTSVSWDVLREHGNQSSASVLFVLRELLRRGVPDGYGLLAAFGPGISIELALLRQRSC
jgi:alkylresorcinol/alkylpyrone synthase